MNQLTTEGIVLSRTNYGEADRIVKLLTPDAGKLSVMARGVRKSKSKLAGSIELFSVSSLVYIKGRGDLGRLISARLETHYGNIVSRIERVQLGYEVIKILDRATEDEPEPEYFTLLQASFAALNDLAIDVEVIRFWFIAQLLRQAGFSPNLHTDVNGEVLAASQKYNFDFDTAAFFENAKGTFAADQIKFLRLAFAGSSPRLLMQVQNATALVEAAKPLTQTMLATHIRI